MIACYGIPLAGADVLAQMAPRASTRRTVLRTERAIVAPRVSCWRASASGYGDDRLSHHCAARSRPDSESPLTPWFAVEPSVPHLCVCFWCRLKPSMCYRPRSFSMARRVRLPCVKPSLRPPSPWYAIERDGLGRDRFRAEFLLSFSPDPHGSPARWGEGGSENLSLFLAIRIRCVELVWCSSCCLLGPVNQMFE